MLKHKIVIGFCMTGSFFTFKYVIPQIKQLVDDGVEVIPIMSYNSYNLDTRFGNAKDFIKEIEDITSNKVIHAITDVEAMNRVDLIAIIPSTGNTIAKLANGITDTPVLVATKLHLRSGNNVVIGISANDGLSENAKNIRSIIK